MPLFARMAASFVWHRFVKLAFSDKHCTRYNDATAFWQGALCCGLSSVLIQYQLLWKRKEKRKKTDISLLVFFVGFFIFYFFYFYKPLLAVVQETEHFWISISICTRSPCTLLPECDSGYYGAQCTQPCGEGCEGGTCNTTDGTCLCLSGWKPPTCNTGTFKLV